MVIGDEVFIGVYKYSLVDVRRRLELVEEGEVLEDIQELIFEYAEDGGSSSWGNLGK